MNEAFVQGFMDKCAEHNVDPEELIKLAQRGGQLTKLVRALDAMKDKAFYANDSGLRKSVDDVIRQLEHRVTSLPTGALAPANVRKVSPDRYTRAGVTSDSAPELMQAIRDARELLRGRRLDFKSIVREHDEHNKVLDMLKNREPSNFWTA